MRITTQRESGSRTREGLALLFFISATLLGWLVFSPLLTPRAAPARLLPGDLARPASAPLQQAAPDLALSKTHDGDFAPGGQGLYTLTVANAATQTVTGPVTVTDSLPPELTPGSPSGTDWSCTPAGQEVTCTHPNAAGLTESASLPPIALPVTVSQEASGVVTNTATLSHAGDLNPANDSAADPTVIQAAPPQDQADLALAKSVSPGSAENGDLVTFTITATNRGPLDAAAITISDTLPAGLSYVSHNALAGSFSPTSGAWSLPALANGNSALLELSARVEGAADGDELTNTATVAAADPADPEPSNDSASATVFVDNLTRLTGRITSLNGAQPVVGATVVITDSANHTYTTNSDASGSYAFSESPGSPLAAGAATLRATHPNYYPNAATVQIINGQTTTADLELDTTELIVTKSDGQSAIDPSDTLTYTIAITNTGTVDAEDIVVTDTLSSYLSFITDTVGVAPRTATATTRVWALPDPLAPGEGTAFTLRARVASTLPAGDTEVVNRVQVATASREANITNNSVEDRNLHTQDGEADLEVEYAVSPSEVRLNQTLTFTLRVRNEGDAQADNVTVSDTFSSYLTLVSVSTTKGSRTFNAATRSFIVYLGTLEEDDSATITIVTRVASAPTSTSSISNDASVTYRVNNLNRSTSSNTVTFRILAGPALPGTGFAPVRDDSGSGGSGLGWSALLSVILLWVLGLGAIGYGLWARRRSPEWAGWSLKTGFALAGVGLLFGLAYLGLQQAALQREAQRLAANIPAVEAPAAETGEPAYAPNPWVPAYPTDEPETLPDYPVPSPSPEALEGKESEQLDTSNVTRVSIPAIGLDTVVKYVPFDGMTWLIGGLREEVAWMGETSWPGLGGNTALAGHVTLRGGGDGPFRYLDRLEAGDTVTVYTDEKVYTYQVRETRMVEEGDLSVIDTTGGTVLTLITCAEWNAEVSAYLKRLVVFNDLIEVKPFYQEVAGN